MNEKIEARVVKHFTALASLSSPSWHEEKVIRYITRQFDKLGVTWEKYPCGESYNLYGVLEGDGLVEPLLFSAHMDTVGPCEKITPVIKKDRITSDGTSVLGSDDKSALAIYLTALEILKEEKRPHGTIEFLFTCAEEVGLQGIKCMDLSVPLSRKAFVYDNGGSVGTVVTRAPFHSTMEITVKGRAAHAGMEPENGINAIIVLAHILTLLPSGRLDSETTCNAGIIAGGQATNIVPEEARCRLEVRAMNRKRLAEVEQQIRNTAKSIAAEHGVKTAISRELEYSGFSLSEKAPIVAQVSKALKSIGITPKLAATGGGSDTNILNKAGIKAVNLSCGMQKIHSTKEFILIKDLVQGTAFTLALIEEA